MYGVFSECVSFYGFFFQLFASIRLVLTACNKQTTSPVECIRPHLYLDVSSLLTMFFCSDVSDVLHHSQFARIRHSIYVSSSF